MTARVLMVQGTSSNAGKSFFVGGLLRWFRRHGLSVAPFKAQNMALNAAVTPGGGEIGRAQAEQADAAGVPIHVDMNPILLKPEGGFRSQVVVMGRPIGTMTFREYRTQRDELRAVVLAALERLRQRHDLVVIEGAGSPAEINLQSGDLVNMFIARSVDAPVLLITDIDRGGAFASLYGTWALLPPEERSLIRGFVMNRIRGDASLLESGYRQLEALTGVPVLGAIPYLQDYSAAEEDSLGLEARRRRPRARWNEPEVAIVDLPHLSNYDEFRWLEQAVTVRFVQNPREGLGADLVVVPGSKCTIDDLAWVRATGWADVLSRRADRGDAVLGICGGCQILGRTLTEDASTRPGLGLLPVHTHFRPDKRTTRVRVRILGLPDVGSEPLDGYEIHHGRLRLDDDAAPFGRVETNPEPRLDGAVAGSVCGTMVHGLFETESAARALLAWACARQPSPALLSAPENPTPGQDDLHDRAADALAELDLVSWSRRVWSLDLSTSSDRPDDDG